MAFDRGSIFWKRAAFGLIFIFLLWFAHALGYLVHEYAHSFMAWALGYKANPLAITYGHLDLGNILILKDMDENVRYSFIFDSGHRQLVALIAVSGVLFGNGIFYLLSRRLYKTAKAHGRRMLALFMFLFCMMNVGNFISYVPVRTFTTHADMSDVERALSISPWWIILVLGIPFWVAVWHFFARLLPGATKFFFPQTRPGQIFLVLLSAFVVFGFFGSPGLYDYGVASHWISVSSICVLFPLTSILCWPRRNSKSAVQQKFQAEPPSKMG